jgi:site-specific DNA-methyltransferase (adenine-specific)
MEKSARNKTISLSSEEIETLSSRCVMPSDGDFSHAVIHGDTFDIMPSLPDNFARLMIADPPYNLTKTYGDSVFSRMSRQKYLSFTEKWLDASMRLLTHDASVYICCDWQSGSVIEEALSKRFIIRNRITWQREKGRGALANWKNSMEDIWFATVSDDYIFNLDKVRIRRKVVAPYRSNGLPKDWEETPDGKFRDTCPSNFWDDITVPYWSMAENTPHPAQKPEKLIAKLILASSLEGDTVFDPFLGSGTSAVTASKLGRGWCGIEKESSCCAWAIRRLEEAEKNKSIQGYRNGVFWERNVPESIMEKK